MVLTTTTVGEAEREANSIIMKTSPLAPRLKTSCPLMWQARAWAREDSAAVAAISFNFCHPECLIKTPNKTSDAEKEGYVFATDLCTPKVFKGTMTTGTLNTFKKKLQSRGMSSLRLLSAGSPS